MGATWPSLKLKLEKNEEKKIPREKILQDFKCQNIDTHVDNFVLPLGLT